jgi:hypothetical protein
VAFQCSIVHLEREIHFLEGQSTAAHFDKLSTGTSTSSARAGEQGRHSASLHERRGQARAERSQNRCHAASAVLLSTFSNLLSGVPAPPGCQILEGFGRCPRVLEAEIRVLRGTRCGGRAAEWVATQKTLTADHAEERGWKEKNAGSTRQYLGLRLSASSALSVVQTTTGGG